MPVLAALLTHRWARLADMEALTQVPEEALRTEVARLPAVREVVVLRTCNRVEVYAATAHPESARAQVAELVASRAPAAAARLRWAEDEDAARHLFRVAAGLDSMVPGEAQVLGQVRDAHLAARAGGQAGPELGALFGRAVRAGQRVRAETAFGKGAVSVGTATVRLARTELRSLHGKRVVLVGTGEMAGLVARALRGEGCDVAVTGRSAARARILAGKVGGQAVSLAELPGLARAAHVLVFATAASQPLLDRRQLDAWRGAARRRLVVLDLGNPRNVAPDVARAPGVRVLDIDSLRDLRRDTLRKRKAEAASAERVVRAELAELRSVEAEQAAEALLRALHLRVGELREAEVRKALQLMGAGGRERDVLEGLAASLASKLLAEPTRVIRGLAREREEEALRIAALLFGMEEHVPDEAVAQAAPE